MARTALEDRQQILADLAIAIDQIALVTACLGQAYEQLDVSSADRLEQELFKPAQKALGRAKRAYGQFAGRVDLPDRGFETPSAGLASQGAKRFVQRAAQASAAASETIAALQDSMLPIEAGDPELRAGLAEVRELLDDVPGSARQLLRTLGR